jgi:hypothetical protein
MMAVDSTAVGQDPPPAASTTPPNAAAQADAAKAAMIRASQRYFRAVGNFIADAQRLNRANSLRQQVMWLENYARRIEAMPTRGVDPDLAKYGQFVAQTFRWVVDQAYGVEQKQEAIAATEGPSETRVGWLPTWNTVNWGGYRMREYAPYGWVQNNRQEQLKSAGQRQQLEDALYKMIEDARQTLTKLVADHETMRSEMSQRYGVQFR